MTGWVKLVWLFQTLLNTFSLMAEINLKKLLNESMLKEIDQDCIILNEEQADELYGGAEWGYYGNCSFGNCH